MKTDKTDVVIEGAYLKWCGAKKITPSKELRTAFDAGYGIGHLDATVEAMLGIAKHMATQVEQEAKHKQEKESAAVATTAA